MSRAVLISAMMGGLLACPLVCWERDHCGGPCCDSQESDDSAPRAPDPCQKHGCVCAGAVEARPDPAWALGGSAAVCQSVAARPVREECARADLPASFGEGPPLAHLESGRAIRLFLESLLL